MAVAFGASCEYRGIPLDSDSARRPPPSAEGRFGKTPFAHVLLYIREHKLNGSLSIDGPANGPMAGEHFFVFEQGALAQAWLASGLDRFGDLLVELKLVAAANRADAEVILSAEQALVGDVFTEMGLIEAETVPRVLKEQNKRRTQRIFSLGNATYRFYQNIDLLEGFGRERFPLDVLGLVWRGVSASPPHATIDQTLAKLGPNAVKLRDETSLKLFEFERDVDPLLAAIRRSPVTVAELEGFTSDPQLARTLVYVLLTSKQAEIVVMEAPSLDDELPLPPPPPPTRSSVPTPFAGISRPLAPAPVPVTTAPRTASGAIIPPPLSGRSATASPTPSNENTVGNRSASLTPPVPTAPRSISHDDFRKTTPTKPPLSSSDPNINRKTGPTSSSSSDAAVIDALKLLAQLEEQTYFQMLGIEENATDEQLRGSFMKIAAKWHPDRAPSATAREAFQKVFALINEAHLTLVDPKSRERYSKIAKDGGGTPAAQKKVAQMLEASSLAQRAEIQLRRKDIVDAEKLAREAYSMNPTDPSVLAVLGSILYEKNSADHLAEAITILNQAIVSAPKNDKAQVYLGHALKRKGDLRKAIHHYKLALDANPKNVDAQREMRIAEMRARNPQAPPEPAQPEPNTKPKENENILSKLFKR